VIVILSTHIVEDVRELCPRMAIISNGQLLVEGSPAEALDSLRGKLWSKVVSTDAELSAIDANFNVVSTHLVGGLHEVRVYSDTSPGDGFTQDDANLEDVYFLTLSKQTNASQAPSSQAKN
jgi:ABC-2 type transport system ATP-binding protein